MCLVVIISSSSYEFLKSNFKFGLPKRYMYEVNSKEGYLSTLSCYTNDIVKIYKHNYLSELHE